MENKLRRTVSRRLNEEMQPSTNFVSKTNLIRRLVRGREARVRFVESHLSKGISFQAQSLRDKEGWSQPELAAKLGSSQNAVYRLENPNYGKHTISTLRKVAAVFDVALIVQFVPFSKLVDWVSGTPHVDLGLNPNVMEIPNFNEEIALGNFDAKLPLETSNDDEGSETEQQEQRDLNPGKVLSMADHLGGKVADDPSQDQPSGPLSGISIQSIGGSACATLSGSPR